MACEYFPKICLLECLFWWIPALTMHPLPHFQLGECDGTHIPQRNHTVAALGICNLPCLHPLHPNCQYIAEPLDRSLHNTESAECRSLWPIGYRGPVLRTWPRCSMPQNGSTTHT